MKTCYAAALILGMSGTVQAADVTITATLNSYSGDGAYLAIYLADSNGKYSRTLWVAGGKNKYYKHLPEWARGGGNKATEYDGLTGASITSGGTLTVNAVIDDALIDTGYVIRVDTAVEDQREHRIDAELPLTRSGADKPVSGRGYINTISYSL